jgi:hypothetical protein
VKRGEGGMVKLANIPVGFINAGRKGANNKIFHSNINCPV